ncbi:MAG TPA: BtpA/SgcQ family protein [Aggregatilineales bacterium]|nr:BtpA/SgcQ family protein [Anaerolineae bacterium]HUN09234.1 BtpA/SgcQ family protein [Aggregatilineales bacterium]
MSFNGLFTAERPVIGMVHLKALPGAPAYAGDLDAIFAAAWADADALLLAGVDAMIVENFHDEPFMIGEPTTEQLALMAAITRDIVLRSTIPVGVNVQFNAWQAEIAVAHAARAAFVRVEVFVDRVLMAQGIVEPCAAQITRYRAALGAKVQLWADVQTKYTTNIVPQPITQSAKDAQAAGADALIVTGAATGKATPLDDVAAVKEVVKIPVLVGSGTTAANAADVLKIADGAIVGSALKQDGLVSNPVSVRRTTEFMAAARTS